MAEIMSSEMATEELNKVAERKEEIASTIEERKAQFDNETVEKREEIIEEVKELQSENKTLEEREKELKNMENTLKEQEERFSMANLVEPKMPEERKDVLDTEEYRNAWVNYIKSGKEEEVRALTSATSNIPVPTLMQNYIETAWEKFGKFSRLVTKSYVKGYLSIPVELAAGDAVWHAENSAAPTEESITFGEVLLQPKMIKKWISLTDELMGLTSDEFIRYIADELVYRVVLLLDNSIINGTQADSKGVIGILNAGASYVASVTATTFGFNTINEAVAQLKTFDNLTVAMNQSTFFSTVMGLADTAGRPIYQVATDNAGKPQYFINGIKVEFTNALPAYSAAESGAAYAVVGNFAGYRLNLPNGEGVDTLVDPYTLATEDKVRFVGKLFAAGNVARLGHFAKIVK